LGILQENLGQPTLTRRLIVEAKLKSFLDDAFKPYGEFPARADVTKELLANLEERYSDLKNQGLSDEDAYRQTVDSLGDVSEIMEQVPHQPTENHEQEGTSLRKTIKNAINTATRSHSKFGSSALQQSDLSDSNLAGADFSYSALMESNFDGSNLIGSQFRAAALKNASFKGSDLTNASFKASDLQGANFEKANLSGTILKSCSLKGTSFKEATLNATDFNQSDLTDVSFEGQTLEGTSFNGAQMKRTSFKDAVLKDVSFHHSDVKHTIFDGTTMDKVTYALLKGGKAKVENAKIV
jgi:BTB/POZ domain-containing protein KCTD9